MDPSNIIGEQKEHTVVLTDGHLAASPRPSRGGGSPIPESPPGPQRFGTAEAQDPAERVGGHPALPADDDTTRRNDAAAAQQPVLRAARDDGAAAPTLAGELLKRMDSLRTMNADLRQQLEQFTEVGRTAALKQQEEKRS